MLIDETASSGHVNDYCLDAREYFLGWKYFRKRSERKHDTKCNLKWHPRSTNMLSEMELETKSRKRVSEWKNYKKH